MPSVAGLGLVTDLDLGADGALSAAAALLAQSVPEAIAGLVPYHAAGYVNYLAAALELPADARTVVVRVIVESGRPVAVADWRVLDDELFLNGVAVAEEYRRRGFGRLLMHDGVELTRDRELSRLSLDVAADNDAARQLYAGMGFVDVSSAYWHHVATPGTTSPRRLAATDWPQFQAHRAAYGFGDLTVRQAGGGTTRVRLVGRAMRLEATATADPGVLAYRGILRADRLCMVSNHLPGAANVPFAHFRRMSLALAEPSRITTQATRSEAGSTST